MMDIIWKVILHANYVIQCGKKIIFEKIFKVKHALDKQKINVQAALLILI